MFKLPIKKGRHVFLKPLLLLVGCAGFEPVTSCV